jgi:endoglucanase
VNAQLAALWKQIAGRMRDFDQRLLFAGTNEVHHGWSGTPSAENIEVQHSFNQTFVNAVRGTGGRNAYRNLIVQAYSTNIDYAVQYFTLPRDTATGRLMLEVHYYDPWEFTIMANDDPGLKLVWGNRAEAPVQGDDPRKPSWGDETFADGQFAKMKTAFVDKGIPVIVGEYSSTFRTGLGDNQADHDASNVYYMGYVTRAMVANGLVPVYWDNGAPGNGSGLFDRQTYETVHADVLDAIIGK